MSNHRPSRVHSWPLWVSSLPLHQAVTTTCAYTYNIYMYVCIYIHTYIHI
jgi:hypothetical protein